MNGETGAGKFLVARVISSSCPRLWGPCPDRPLQLIGHGGRDWAEVHCFVLGRTPGAGKGYPVHHSGLENAMDCIVHGVAKSWTRLSDFHFHFSCFVAWIWPVGAMARALGLCGTWSPNCPGPPSHPPALRPEGLDSTWRGLCPGLIKLWRGLLTGFLLVEHDL